MFHENYTPTPVIHQGVEALKLVFELGNYQTILDPSAGSGAFGSVFREVFSGSRTKGMEMRAEEAWWLSRNYDQYEISSFQVQKEKQSLIVTNPPFDRWTEIFIKSWKSLRRGGVLSFLGLTSWGSRSEEGVELFKKYCPVVQMRIPGTVGFRGKGKGSDTRDYCWWAWKKSETLLGERMWVALNLPRLEAKDRTWVVPPGKETGYGKRISICRKSFLLSSFEW